MTTQQARTGHDPARPREARPRDPVREIGNNTRSSLSHSKRSEIKLLSRTSVDNGGPVGYLELIQGNRNFRWLWLGQIVSLLGDWFNLIASAALVATLTHSGFAVGGLFVVRMLAPFLASPLAGVAADRYSRKRILILADLVRAVTVLGFLLVRDASAIWLLYALSAIQLGISGFFFTARTAILPDVVVPQAVGTANAISSATWSVMLAFGAAAGGLIAGTVGIYPAFVIDSLTFLVSAALLVRIRLDPRAGTRASEKTIRAAFKEYREGLAYLSRHRDTLLVASQKAALMLFFGATFHVVQVGIAEEVFVVGKGGSLGVGLLFAIAGVGTGVGPLLTRGITGDREPRLRIAILVGYLIGAFGLWVTSVGTSLAGVLAGSLLVGTGGGHLWVFSTQLLLQKVPGHVRGRVLASEFALFTLVSAAGAALAGGAIDSPLGIAGVLRLMAGLSLLPALWWAFSLSRSRA